GLIRTWLSAAGISASAPAWVTATRVAPASSPATIRVTAARITTPGITAAAALSRRRSGPGRIVVCRGTVTGLHDISNLDDLLFGIDLSDFCGADNLSLAGGCLIRLFILVAFRLGNAGYCEK